MMITMTMTIIMIMMENDAEERRVISCFVRTTTCSLGLLTTSSSLCVVVGC